MAKSLRPETPHGRLDDSDLVRISELVTRETGIRLLPAKRLMIEGRLRRRQNALGMRSLADYARHLFGPDRDAGEIAHLIDAFTTNKTDFFREPQHFTLMENTLMPELLDRRGDRMPLIKVWSAACSTGAEPYTIAMVLASIAARQGNFRFGILGTDISTQVLETARRAIYPLDQLDPVPPALRDRYIMRPRDPRRQREARIVPELRRLTRFDRLNLMDRSYPYDRDVDMIFLRNVLIYFAPEDQAAVVARLAGHLRRGGYLFLGHSESMVEMASGMAQVAPATFRKI
mgnify:CR=1 FL=1